MQERKTNLAAITNFNFLGGNCHSNVHVCGPCLGSGINGGVCGGVDGVCVGPGVDIGVGARGCIGVCVVAEQPDSIIKDETATAAC